MKTFAQYTEEVGETRQVGKLVIVKDHSDRPALGILEKYELTKFGVKAVCTYFDGMGFSYGYFAPSEIQPATPQNIPPGHAENMMSYLDNRHYAKSRMDVEKLRYQLQSLAGTPSKTPVQGRLF